MRKYVLPSTEALGGVIVIFELEKRTTKKEAFNGLIREARTVTKIFHISMTNLIRNVYECKSVTFISS